MVVLHEGEDVSFAEVCPRHVQPRSYFVYIVASKMRVLYIGVTNNIGFRVWQHKRKQVPGFTDRYHVDRLVFFEIFGSIRAAIAREKQLKKWRREKKLKLVETKNPKWKDLSAGWFKGWRQLSR